MQADRERLVLQDHTIGQLSRAQCSSNRSDARHGTGRSRVYALDVWSFDLEAVVACVEQRIELKARPQVLERAAADDRNVRIRAPGECAENVLQLAVYQRGIGSRWNLDQ